jgi:hypothetical protein
MLHAGWESIPRNLFDAMRFDQGMVSGAEDLTEWDIRAWHICVTSDAVTESLQKTLRAALPASNVAMHAPVDFPVFIIRS